MKRGFFDSQSFKDKKQAEKAIQIHAQVIPYGKGGITQRAEPRATKKNPESRAKS